MSTDTGSDGKDRRSSNIEDERDAYKEALEEILAQCNQTERSTEADACEVAVQSQIPSLANEVLTLYAPDPEPVPDEELPFP